MRVSVSARITAAVAILVAVIAAGSAWTAERVSAESTTTTSASSTGGTTSVSPAPEPTTPPTTTQPDPATAQPNPVPVPPGPDQLPESGLGAPPQEHVLFRVGVGAVDPQQVPGVQRVADYLLAHPNVPVRVEGHTDSSGEEAVNQWLSEQRARSVAGVLEAHGVAPDRITVVGLSTTRNVADNATEAGRAANRRVEFSFG
ncbi:OmpA family protein [Millisia brevis]|uniref:OmpA family protein n=1 Tax=Millisia brevis TaxID=264148 RepID=UPI000831BE84|nr:OmpA family protein [Millisia brevis]